ncbi:MAG: hypothetical protein H6822_35020 [Planctomycetaceae bacterium]|nr:hypothetical protein [Planctomycetales bacterium]MCB9927399.1 hypothetical protein [Planctomycetaceae bacterium]
MIRLVIATTLIVAGVLLAHDVGHVAGKMTLAVTRNPATIAVTGYLSKNAPPAVFAFEQDVLFHFALAPYFIFAGGLVGLTTPFRDAKYGTLVPLAYAVWFSVLLVRMAADTESLAWLSFLDVIVTSFALIPLYLLGVNVGQSFNERRCPQWVLADCLIAFTIGGILCFAVVNRPFMLIPTTMTATACFLAWRTWPPMPKPAEPSDARETSAQSVLNSNSTSRSP